MPINSPIFNLYDKIVNDYKTGKYTQEQLAIKYNIPVEIIRMCTQYEGINRRIVQNEKKGVQYENHLEFLIPYLS